jgi:hypothetical protein
VNTIAVFLFVAMCATVIPARDSLAELFAGRWHPLFILVAFGWLLLLGLTLYVGLST